MVGTGNAMGVPVTLAQAYEMIFGYVLLNDWSARDIQAWEYVPLGPFRAKVSATTISPWIVTREALEPYREMTPPRVQPLLPCLREPEAYNQDLALQILLEPAGAAGATSITRTNQRYTYYSSVQHTDSPRHRRLHDADRRSARFGHHFWSHARQPWLAAGTFMERSSAGSRWKAVSNIAFSKTATKSRCAVPASATACASALAAATAAPTRHSTPFWNIYENRSHSPRRLPLQRR